jgi:hypothetical protein
VQSPLWLHHKIIKRNHDDPASQNLVSCICLPFLYNIIFLTKLLTMIELFVKSPSLSPPISSAFVPYPLFQRHLSHPLFHPLSPLLSSPIPSFSGISPPNRLTLQTTLKCRESFVECTTYVLGLCCPPLEYFKL